MDIDQFEILTGKFIDGEIEPSEQRLLDAALAADPQHRRLFEELQSLHTRAQAEVTPLAVRGKPFETVFAAAWKQSRRGQRRPLRLPMGTLRFVSGMAAGLLLAVLIQAVREPAATPPVQTAAVPTPSSMALNDGPDRILTRAAGSASSPVIKDVDYYYYIDENGQRWLIEGYRENINTQMVSYQDL